MESLQFHAPIKQDENGGFIGTLDEIEDIVVSGGTAEDVLSGIAKDLVEYAEDYLADSFLPYFNAPTRRVHFPYM